MLDNNRVRQDEFEVSHAHQTECDKHHGKMVGELLLVPALSKAIDHREDPIAGPEHAPSEENHDEI